MQDSRGREARYVMHGPVAAPGVLQPRATPTPAQPTEHLLLIGACCFLAGFTITAAILRHRW